MGPSGELAVATLVKATGNVDTVYEIGDYLGNGVSYIMDMIVDEADPNNYYILGGN